MNVKANQLLPNFIGKTYNGQEVDLSDFAGEGNLVLYFYPKDDTPGCTIEGIEFSELNKEFRKLNTLVVGISRDNLDSHQRFCHKHNIRIPLLSDAEGAYGRKLGLLKNGGVFKRTTILVGRDGKIKHIWEDVKANGHAREVLGKVRDLENQTKKKIAIGKDLGPHRRNYAKPSVRAAAKARIRARKS